MKFHRFFAAAGLIAAVSTIALSSALAQTSDGVPAKTIITVLPKHSEQAPPIQPHDLKIQVNGRSAQADTVTPLRGDRAGLELVVLIDSGARTSLGRQMGEIGSFVKSLPPSTQVAIAYMMNGRAVFQQPFTDQQGPGSARAASSRWKRRQQRQPVLLHLGSCEELALQRYGESARSGGHYRWNRSLRRAL